MRRTSISFLRVRPRRQLPTITNKTEGQSTTENEYEARKWISKSNDGCRIVRIDSMGADPSRCSEADRRRDGRETDPRSCVPKAWPSLLGCCRLPRQDLLS